MAQKYIHETIWEIAGDGNKFKNYTDEVLTVLNALVDFAATGEQNCQAARKLAQQLVKHVETPKTH